MRRKEEGQAIVLIAVSIILLLISASLAVDGGMALVQRRIAQNGADAASVRGALYLSSPVSPITEESLLAYINWFSQVNGIEDTDGDFGNHINANVDAYYTTEEGERLVSCNQVGTCGGIPADALGIEVETSKGYSAFIAGLIGWDRFSASARAVATVHPGSAGNPGEFAVFAGSETCTDSIVWDGLNNRIEGNLHSNSGFYQPGNNNEVVGQATSSGDYDGPGSGNTYNGAPPSSSNPDDNEPVQEWPVVFNIADFQPGGVWSADPNYHDAGSAVIDERYLIDQGWLTGGGSSWVLEDGIYYTTNDIVLTTNGLVGNSVTFVSESEIYTNYNGGSNVTAYAEGLLFYSNMDNPNCNQYAIHLSGNNNEWNGVIYAPRAGVEFNGNMTDSVARGGVIAHHVRINSNTFELIFDATYFPGTPDRIELIY